MLMCTLNHMHASASPLSARTNRAWEVKPGHDVPNVLYPFSLHMSDPVVSRALSGTPSLNDLDVAWLDGERNAPSSNYGRGEDIRFTESLRQRLLLRTPFLKLPQEIHNSHLHPLPSLAQAGSSA